jgi:AcrR family transcriptional regulator
MAQGNAHDTFCMDNDMTNMANSKIIRLTKQYEPQIPEKTKDRLYPAVLKLFSSNDFHQVKMRTISQESGVSVSNIYKYFSSKEDLLFTCLEEKIKSIHELVETHVQGLQSGKEIFRKTLWVTMDYYDRYPELAITAFVTVPTRTWMQQEGYPGTKLKQVFADVVNKLKDDGEIDPRIDVRLFQDIYYMICYRYIYTWYYFGKTWKLVEAINQDFDVLWKLLQRENSLFTLAGAS